MFSVLGLRRLFAKKVTNKKFLARKNSFESPSSEKLEEAAKARAANLEMQKARYNNPERQRKYFKMTPGLQEEMPSEKEVTKQILQTTSMEALLNVYENKKFYYSARQLLTTLSQFTRILPDFLKYKKMVIYQAAKRRAHGAPSMKRYDSDHDVRIASLLRQLSQSHDSLSLEEKVFAVWVLAKGQKQFDAKDQIQALMSKILPQLPLLTHKELSLCFWALGKTELKKKENIGILGIEMEQRIKARMDLEQSLFETHELEHSARRPEFEADNEEDGDVHNKNTENNKFLEDEEPQIFDPNFLPDYPDVGYTEHMSDIIRSSEIRDTSAIPIQAICMYFYSLTKLNVVDSEYAGPIFHRMVDEGVMHRLNLTQLNMIIPALVRTNFKDRANVVEQIYNRFENLLKTPKDLKGKDSMENALALKSIIAAFPGLNSIFSNPDLLLELVRKFAQLNPNPSIRFISEITWALWRVPIKSVPPFVCKYIEAAVTKNIEKFHTRDLVAIIYSIGRLLRRQHSGEIKDINFSLGTLMTLLLNEIAIKKEHLDSRQRSMLQEVKKDLAINVPLAKRVID